MEMMMDEEAIWLFTTWGIAEWQD